ncbi:hypothetical protein OG883_20355 [Streptomyces sp. NBC_01142]|uniref:hypothetical protein n=1 Tax=Streptomyces sp. NBC_01142 TaxID=2975865 RepID=UPI002253E5D5|nr:hypothetical protein [Streptomyces sp. NBC_01142]MCX4822196.1 hypothetical protein [Streptomyces sp. NBC_01142]
MDADMVAVGRGPGVAGHSPQGQGEQGRDDGEYETGAATGSRTRHPDRHGGQHSPSGVTPLSGAR